MKWATWNIEKPTVDGWQNGPVDIMFHNNLHPSAIIKMPDQANTNPFGIPELPSTAYLMGTDKPIVELHSDGWYLVFYDSPVIHRSVIERSILGIGWDDLLFYWDPDCVPLMIKQAHAVMNAFRNNPGHPGLLRAAGPREQAYKRFINKFIYPDYQLIWQAQDTAGHIAPTSDDWFINQMQGSATKIWHDTLSQYSNLLADTTNGTSFCQYIKPDNGSANYNVLVDCPSKRYYLGPV
jgi:hypothetical protein